MRAITISGYGDPRHVLHLKDIAEPTIAEDEVLVRIEAASLNPADWHLIRGIPYVARLSVGLRRPDFEVPGSDFAGIVEAVGAAVTTLAPCDPVFGTAFMAGFGALAEKVAVPERLVAKRPADVPAEEAAAAPLAASTALQALRDHGQLRAGQHVLVLGASGGVGTYAVQLAKHLGAEVTGVCSAANLDLVSSLGAEHVVDYTTTDLTQLPDRYDLILHLAGTHPAKQLRRLLTPTGTLVQLSGDSGNRWLGPIGRIIGGRLGAVRSKQTVTTFTVNPNRDDLVLLAELLRTGALHSHVEHAFALDDIVTAVNQVESGRTRGKVAVHVATSDLDEPATKPAVTVPER